MVRRHKSDNTIYISVSHPTNKRNLCLSLKVQDRYINIGHRVTSTIVSGHFHVSVQLYVGRQSCQVTMVCVATAMYGHNCIWV